MTNMTMAIPAELHKKMKKHHEVKWTEVARNAFERKLLMIELEKDPLRKYAYQRLAEEGDDADDIFEY